MSAPDLEPGDPGNAPTEAAPAAPPLADRLARAELKARLFGASAEPARVGRFVVLHKLGAGGMGVVYAAHDEELGRKVAIKLVHPGRQDPESRARSRREAQALARLSHPNVVQVYEVGEYAGQVYLAMEFVQGTTLRAWHKLAPRSWQATLAMYLQAGQGLAAAHARGLVHRDFKPDNVLVDDEEGRPRVLDFGLARVPGSPGDLSPETAESPVPADPDEAARLTTPGAVLGTPAYMAPEQLTGGEADVRSDVFGFCAALHEALYGVRPFTGEHRETLHAAILRGEFQRPARAPDVPLWLQRMVERGLAADPAARWPAMQPLLTALARGPTRRRRRLRVIVGVLAVGVTSVLGVLAFQGRQQEVAAAEDRGAAVRDELERSQGARADEQRHGEARRLAAAAGQRGDQDPVTGLLLAVEAVATHTRVGAEPIVEAEQALLDALDSVRSVPFLRPGAALVDTLAESPDGRWLATGERDGSVTLWPTDDPRAHRRLQVGDGHAVHALAFNPAGDALAAARAGEGVLVWTLPTTGANDHYARDDPPVRWDSPVDLRDLEWSPRDRALLARAGDLAYVLRPDGEPLVLRGHTASVRRATWSPDGAQIVTASADGSARVWPARGGAPRLVRLDGGRRGLWSAEFSPDGLALALASADHSAAIVPLRGGPVRRLRGHTDEVYAVGFSPDGERVITVAMDASARVWERDGSSTRVDLPGHGEALGGARLGPDRNLLLGTPAGGVAWLWQLDRPGPPLVLHGHTGSVVAARFSADGRRVLTASADGSARRWQFADDPNLLRGHDAGIDHASFAPDGRHIVTAGMDGTTRVWRRDGRPPWVLRGHREGSEVRAAFGPDGRRLASAGSDGKARLWSLTSDPPHLLATLAGGERHAPLLDLAWSPDGHSLALAAEDGQIHLVRMTPEGRLIDTRTFTGHTGPVRVLAFAPDGERLASAGDDGEIRLWRVRESPGPSDILRDHTGPVHSLAFVADGTRLLSAGDDALARVWTLATPGSPQRLRGHEAAIWQVRPLPQAPSITTASADGTARVWPLDGGVPAVLVAHTDAVWVAAPSPDGLQLLTTSSDGTAYLWRIHGDTRRALSLPQRGTAIPGEPDHTLWTGSFSPDGRLVLTAGADGLARVFPVELTAQVAEACARAGRNLGPEAWKRLVGEREYQRTCPGLPD